MLIHIFAFELEQRLRRISTYVYFVVFFALGLLFALMSGGAFAEASVDFGTGGKVLVNSPYALNSHHYLHLLLWHRHYRRHRGTGDVSGHRQQFRRLLLHRADHASSIILAVVSWRLSSYRF